MSHVGDWVRQKGRQPFFLTSDQPTLPFGFEIEKIVKYAGVDSDQLDLILGKNLARLFRIEPKASDPKTLTSRETDDGKSRCVSSVGAEKMDGLSVTRE